jgi:hypothetical protein
VVATFKTESSKIGEFGIKPPLPRQLHTKTICTRAPPNFQAAMASVPADLCELLVHILDEKKP